MLSPNAIQELLRDARAGKRPHGLDYYVDCPELIDALHRFSIPYYIINQEHTTVFSPTSVRRAIQAAERCGAISIVKLAINDPLHARDALDAGAHGLMVPGIETADDMRKLIESCRFPPVGKRTYCYVNQAQHGGAMVTPAEVLDFWKFSNEHVLLIPILETQAAVDNIDDIIAASGDTPVFSIGPLDLALSMGLVGAAAASPADIFPTTPILEKNGVLGMLVSKLHAAGKLVLAPHMGPDPSVSHQELARMVEGYGFDMPYSAILDCLAVGVMDALAVNKFFSR